MSKRIEHAGQVPMPLFTTECLTAGPATRALHRFRRVRAGLLGAARQVLASLALACCAVACGGERAEFTPAARDVDGGPGAQSADDAPGAQSQGTHGAAGASALEPAGGPGSNGAVGVNAPDGSGSQLNNAECGNGVQVAGEACDHGLLNSDTTPNACRSDCRQAHCGDGVIDSDEACDEGDANSDETPNGCRLDCQKARCGDGVQDSGEACDSGSANTDSDPNACSTQCRLAGCGDGMKTAAEACDNGAQNSDSAADACRTSCQIAGCGDGVIDSTETCDDGAGNSATQPGACRADCRMAGCGDGVKDATEACDGTPDCNAECALIVCGDGKKEGSEACDLGPANSDTGECSTLCQNKNCGDGLMQEGEACDDGVLSGDYGTCGPGCTLTARCGDGQVDSGHEFCDDGMNLGGYGNCKPNCQWDARCGDGTLQTQHGEECEGAEGCVECRKVLPAQVVSFTSADAVLPAGGAETTLSWEVRDAQSVSIEPGVGTVTGTSVSVTVNSSTTFTLTAHSEGGSATATVNVKVTAKGIIDDYQVQFGKAASESVTAIAGTDSAIYVLTSAYVTDRGSDGALIQFQNKQQKWQYDFSSASNDDARALALAPNGELLVAGTTAGGLDSSRTADVNGDGFVARVTASKELRWLRAFGTTDYESVNAVAADSSGNAWVCGETGGDFKGTNAGFNDAFVAKLSSSGEVTWKAQLGSDVGDSATGIAVDSAGNVVVVGTSDSVLKSNLTNAGGRDLFVAKFSPSDTSGTPLWIKMLGTDAADFAHAVAVDPNNNIYLAGKTGGTLGSSSGGDHDAILVKFSPDGNVLAKRQFGGDGVETAWTVAVDADGSAYVAGITNSLLDNNFLSPAPPDFFVAKFGTGDQPEWLRQFGSTGNDEVTSMFVDSGGRVVLGGVTHGDLFGTNAGGGDGFIVRYK